MSINISCNINKRIVSILCTTCDNIIKLIIYQFFQAIGAGSGMVILRVIISDMFQKKEAIKVFTTVFPIIALSTVIAPIIGGILTSFFDWRANFLFLTLVRMLILLVIIVFLKETLPQEDKTSISVSNLIRNYSEIVKNSLYVAYTIMISFASGAYFIYLTSSSFIFYELGYETYYIGFFYIMIASSYIFDNLLSKKLMQYIASTKILTFGIIFFVIGGTVMFILSWRGINSGFELIIPMSILTLGNGFLLPVGISNAIKLFPYMAGTASGLVGFFQFGIISMLTVVTNYFLGESAFLMSLTIFIITIICTLSMALVLTLHRTVGSVLRYIVGDRGFSKKDS